MPAKNFLLLSFFSLLLLTNHTKAQQNLVPNPSFEDFISCPDTAESITSAEHWINPTGYTPDYFNACDSSYIYSGNFFDLNRGVPYNIEGTQTARTGVAYAGIITADIGQNEREYIQVKLIDTLLTGKTYYVEFFVSSGDSSLYIANNIGAHFSKNPISSVNTNVLPFSPQIENNYLANPLHDTSIWIKVSGTFVAQGGEKYLTIGNFNDDNSTNITSNPNPPQWSFYSYHYIDDVTVVEEFSNSLEENENEHAIVFIYPNPTKDFIQVSSSNPIESYIIFSSLGKQIYHQHTLSENLQIDLSNFPKGLYYISFLYQKSIVTKKIIIN